MSICLSTGRILLYTVGEIEFESRMKNVCITIDGTPYRVPLLCDPLLQALLPLQLLIDRIKQHLLACFAFPIIKLNKTKNERGNFKSFLNLSLAKYPLTPPTVKNCFISLLSFLCCLVSTLGREHL